MIADRTIKVLVEDHQDNLKYIEANLHSYGRGRKFDVVLHPENMKLPPNYDLYFLHAADLDEILEIRMKNPSAYISFRTYSDHKVFSPAVQDSIDSFHSNNFSKAIIKALDHFFQLESELLQEEMQR